MSICVDSFAPEKQGMAALNLMGGSAAENPARRQALEELAALRKDLFQEQASSFPPPVIEWNSVETSMGDNGASSRPLLGRSSSLSAVDSKRAAAAAADYKEESVCNNNSSSSSSSRAALRRAKTFPPPLGSLARKSYSHCPNQVPWVLLQPIRSKNRIVLQEVKIANQMSFQPIRKEGRLVLNLIRHGDENSCGRPIIAKSSPPTADDVAQEEEAIQISEPRKNVSAHRADKPESEVVVVAAAAKEALVTVEEEVGNANAHQAAAASDDENKNRHAGCSNSNSNMPKLSIDKESHGLLENAAAAHGLLEKDNAAILLENAAHAHGLLEKDNAAILLENAAHAHGLLLENAHGRKYAPRIAHNIKGIMFNNQGDYQLHHQCRCSNKKREDDHHRPTIWEQHHNFHCVTTSS